MENQIYLDRLNALSIEKGHIQEINFLEAESAPVDFDGCALLPLPERCQVTYKLYPTEQSDITCVITLPLNGWNKKFLGTGNGGQAGEIVWKSIDAGVTHGYATANTDMGSSLTNKPMYLAYERWIDFAHRATHLMTVVGKQIIEAFYGEPPQKSYFLGSSTGGNQAMQEAQKYPEDYDGIVAVCPAFNRFALQYTFNFILQTMCGDSSSVFSPEQIVAVKQRVLERFAVVSGSAEGDSFLSYPGKIGFKPEDTAEIFAGLGLNQAQLNVLQTLYGGPKNPTTGEIIFVPMPLGCEESALVVPGIVTGYEYMLGFFQRWGFGQNCDYMKITYEDYCRVIGPYRKEFDATDPDLSAYKARGGKLILVTGANDTLIPYSDGYNYYKSVLAKMGGEKNVSNFFRYFHVPGLGHCQGGPGLQEIGAKGGIATIPYDSEHDAVQAVAFWAEENIAPEILYASAFKGGDMTKEVDFERPIYPYPYETEYIGGDRKNKNNFRKSLGNGVY